MSEPDWFVAILLWQWMLKEVLALINMSLRELERVFWMIISARILRVCGAAVSPMLWVWRLGGEGVEARVVCGNSHAAMDVETGFGFD